MTVKVFISAGEASGDLHGSHLVRALINRDADTQVVCLGGPLLREAGAHVLVENRDLAVVGVSEVLGSAQTIYKAWKKIRSHILVSRPDVVVLIDFPDFNFLLGRLAKRLGTRVVYYIGPQIWAWRSGRAKSLTKFVDEMAVILPFEPGFYESYKIKVHYVGHPLLDAAEKAISREEASDRYRPENNARLVGLLPGSRHSEIHALLHLLLESASKLKNALPDIAFLLPVAPTMDARSISEEAARYNLPVRLVIGDTYGAIRACDLIIAASGTVTLEAAILGTPMIIVYRVSALSYLVGRRLIKLKHVGLPNLIAGREIVPELLQEQASSERIANEALTFLNYSGKLDLQRQELAMIRRALGSPGVADRVARLILRLSVAEPPATEHLRGSS